MVGPVIRGTPVGKEVPAKSQRTVAPFAIRVESAPEASSGDRVRVTGGKVVGCEIVTVTVTCWGASVMVGFDLWDEMEVVLLPSESPLGPPPCVEVVFAP
jgi:hypothetical protein